jgi:GH25 family lysozyme M1 (1,4-beta-N-acetylmuramidase)
LIFAKKRRNFLSKILALFLHRISQANPGVGMTVCNYEERLIKRSLLLKGGRAMGINFSSFSIRGIDVSQFNGTIDWTKVSAHFSAVRVGYGRTIDTKFVTNWQNAKGRVKRIPYWYMDFYSNHMSSSAVYGTADADWGKAQANTCWNALKNDPEGIVFLDIENTNVTGAPPITTVTTRAQTIARAFLEEMDALNAKTNGIYCSLGMLSWFASWFKDRPLWVAWYNEAQTAATVLAAVANKGWTGKCLMWQYASDGDVNDDGSADGITMGMQYKFLDLNGWLASAQDYANLFNSEVVADVPLYKVKIKIYNLLVRSIPACVGRIFRVSTTSTKKRTDTDASVPPYPSGSASPRITWNDFHPSLALKNLLKPPCI